MISFPFFCRYFRFGLVAATSVAQISLSWSGRGISAFPPRSSQTLWELWIFRGKVWRPQGDSSPCYRRERAKEYSNTRRINGLEMQPERYQPFFVTTALPDFTQGEAYIQVVNVQDLQAGHDRLSSLAPEHLRGARVESAMR